MKGRRGQAPLERRRALAPRIGGGPPAGKEGVEYDEDEEQRRGEGDIGAGITVKKIMVSPCAVVMTL
jgi:hypothetical protein